MYSFLGVAEVMTSLTAIEHGIKLRPERTPNEGGTTTPKWTDFQELKAIKFEKSHESKQLMLLSMNKT